MTFHLHLSSCHKYSLTVMVFLCVFLSVLWDFRLNSQSNSPLFSKIIQRTPELRVAGERFFTAFSYLSVLDSHVQGIFEVGAQAGLGGGELSEQLDFPPFSQHFKTTAVVYISIKTLWWKMTDAVIRITHAPVKVHAFSIALHTCCLVVSAILWLHIRGEEECCITRSFDDTLVCTCCR